MTIKFLFGCWHKNTTFPFTPKKSQHQSAAVKDTYVVCLDCGHELPYSWEHMKVLPRRSATRRHGSRTHAAVAQPAGSAVE